MRNLGLNNLLTTWTPSEILAGFAIGLPVRWYRYSSSQVVVIFVGFMVCVHVCSTWTAPDNGKLYLGLFVTSSSRPVKHMLFNRPAPSKSRQAKAVSAWIFNGEIRPYATLNIRLINILLSWESEMDENLNMISRFFTPTPHDSGHASSTSSEYTLNEEWAYHLCMLCISS